MNQENYNDWVSNTNITQQDKLCGGNQISTNEKYFIDKYCKKNILDIGCGTGHRTFPIWIHRKCNFCGIEKFINLINGSRYKEYIIHGDITLRNFSECICRAFAKLGFSENDKIDIACLFGGVINGFLNEETQLNGWTNLKYVSEKSHYILIDTLTHFDWYEKAEKGQIMQLFHLVPPQYFYSKKELIRLIESNSLEICEEKDEYIGQSKRTHYLLSKENI